MAIREQKDVIQYDRARVLAVLCPKVGHRRSARRLHHPAAHLPDGVRHELKRKPSIRRQQHCAALRARGGDSLPKLRQEDWHRLATGVRVIKVADVH